MEYQKNTKLLGTKSDEVPKFITKGAYIKYVGGGAGGFYKFFKKCFIAQETIDLNISWPSNFFRKYFMAPPIII